MCVLQPAAIFVWIESLPAAAAAAAAAAVAVAVAGAGAGAGAGAATKILLLLLMDTLNAYTVLALRACRFLLNVLVYRQQRFNEQTD